MAMVDSKLKRGKKRRILGEIIGMRTQKLAQFGDSLSR